ncbi:hypothetical protein LJB93_01685, partial [Desulfovibrio sp. OttesenSCG-928-F07]|nr:hypothetical protein [Desulfovibrio sp. OttesenSCG-928-F07]
MPATNILTVLKRPALLLIVLPALLLGLVAMPKQALSLPVAVEQVQGSLSLGASAFYMIDKSSSLTITDVSSPSRQNSFVPLKEGLPKGTGGALWMRFSLIKNNIATNAPVNMGQLKLELGKASPPTRMFLAESITAEGEVKQWREYLPSIDGSFDLPEPVMLPLTVYVRFNSMPTLWFNPALERDNGGNMGSDIPWLLIMQVLLGIGMAITIIRGMSENEEWRFWAGAVLACAAISALYGDNGTEKNVIYLAAMPQLLSPGLAIMLMPHLGRYILGNNKPKALDYTLIALSLPGVVAALTPLVPGFGWTSRLLPLAPLLLAPLLLLTIPALKHKQRGSLCYFLFVLLPFAGACAALYSVFAPQAATLQKMGLYLPSLGYMLGGLLIACAKPISVKDKTDFFPLDEYLEHGGIFGEAKTKEATAALNALQTENIDELQLLNAELAETTSILPAEPEKEEAHSPHSIFKHNEEPDQLQDSAPFTLHTHKLGQGDITPRTEAENTNTLPATKAEPLPAEQENNTEADTDGQEATATLNDYLHTSANSDTGKNTATEQDDDEILELNNPVVNPVESMAQLASLFAEDNNTGSAAAQDDAALAAQSKTGSADTQAHAAAADTSENIIYIKDEEEPGLVIIKPAKGNADLATALNTGISSNVEVAAPAPLPTPRKELDYKALTRVESALRTPYEELLRQLNQLRRQQDGSTELAENLAESISALGIMINNLERVANGEEPNTEPAQTIFSISALIRRIHEEMQPMAENKGLTLSWFVAPGLPAFFKGNEENLANALYFLLQGSIEAAESGAVQLTVRKAAEHSDHLQFTLLESGMGIKNMHRPSGWLNKAWELACTSNGSFNIDFIPGKGTAFTFTLALTPVQAQAVAEEPAPQAADIAEFAPESALTPNTGTQELAEDTIDSAQAPLSSATASLNTGTAPLTNTNGQSAAPFAAVTDYTDYAAGTNTTSSNSTNATPAPQNVDFNLESSAKPAPAVLRFTEDPEPENAFVPEEYTDSANYTDSAKHAEQQAAATKQHNEAAAELREYIVVADMAASGRRFIVRRLDGLPHKIVEAHNAQEIVNACAKHPVGLIILDADMPEVDVRNALQQIRRNQQNQPQVPSLCLIAHSSQAERMQRIGCTESQLKSATRTQFRQAVLALCPHPAVNPAELQPESPLLRNQPEEQAHSSTADNNALLAAEAAALAAGADETVAHSVIYSAKAQAKKAATQEAEHLESTEQSTEQNANVASTPNAVQENDKKNSRVSMLDLIVESLDDEDGASSSLPEARKVEKPYKLANTNNEFMDADMVSLIPGFILVFEDAISDLEKARAKS